MKRKNPKTPRRPYRKRRRKGEGEMAKSRGAQHTRGGTQGVARKIKEKKKKQFCVKKTSGEKNQKNRGRMSPP